MYVASFLPATARGPVWRGSGVVAPGPHRWHPVRYPPVCYARFIGLRKRLGQIRRGRYATDRPARIDRPSSAPGRDKLL